MSAYVKVGEEFAVNSETAGNQANPRIATFADGSFLITWIDREPWPASGQAIKAQLYDAGGARVGGEFQVNQPAAGAVFNQTAAVLADGSFVVTWVNNDETVGGPGGVKARHYDSAGHALGGEFLVDGGSAGNEFTAEIAALGSGGFVITWDDWNTQRAQIFGASGGKVGGEFSTSPYVGPYGGNGDVVALAGGGFVASWRTSDGDVQARIFSDSGAPAGAAFLLNTAVSGGQTSPGLTALSGGGFVAVWQTGDTTQDGSGAAIKGQRFTAAGTKAGAEFLINQQTAGDQKLPAVTALGDGGFMVVWETTNTAQDGSGTAVKARQFAADGTAAGNEFLLNTFASGAQWLSDLASLPDGRVVAAWMSEAADGDESGVRAQILFTPNAAPQITSDGGGASASFTIAENVSAVTIVAAIDTDGPQPVSYSIEGGADAALFAIDRTTGALRFVAGPDFEAPGDADGNSIYQVVVGARDGAWADRQSLTITVTNLSDGLSFARTAFAALENGLAGAMLFAWGGDGAPRTYTIAGGADAALFTLNAATGELKFLAGQDREAPGDAGGDGTYEVMVTADDGTSSVTRTISVTLANVNEGQVFLSPVAWTVVENEYVVGTIVASDIDGDALQYYVTGGADGLLFRIASDGVFGFDRPADYEALADANGDNIYEVEITASDGHIFTTQLLTVAVTDFQPEQQLSFVNTAFATDENTLGSVMLGVTGGDVYLPIHFEIAGGVDAAQFAFNPDGSLRFASRDYESPADADGDNVYNVKVTASQGTQFVTATLSFTVHNVEEAPVVSTSGYLYTYETLSSVGWISAYDPEGAALTFSLAGGADAHLFQIGTQTGLLTFISPPDFEAPADADHNNVYKVDVAVSDGALSTVTSLAVSVADAVESLTFDSTAFSTPENTTTVGTVHATGGAGSTSYTIVGGADASRFIISVSGGLLRFATAQNYEAPSDVGGDRVYEVVVRAANGALTTQDTIRVTLTNLNEAPVFGGAATFSVPENTTAIATVQATDPEGQALSYSISGGTDAQFFQINAATGALSFVSPRNYEVRADANANNVYDVTIRASDGSLAATRAVSVTVTNVNEAPVISSGGGGSAATYTINENLTVVTTVAASDPESGAVTYSIAGGADAARFTIASNGQLRFVTAPNFEAPADADANNTYQVIVRARDASLNEDTQTLTVTVGNVNEGLSITSPAALSVAENGSGVTTVTAVDLDGDAVSFAIAGGADAARFAIDGATGALSFVSAPDFEAPADADGNNVYDVVVSGSDGSLSATKAIAVTVSDVSEGVIITSNGGAATAALSLAENTVLATTVTAFAATGAATYSLAGGEDAAFFAIDAITGELSFVSAPDFEYSRDHGFDNVYEVIVRAGNGALDDTQALSITVGDVEEAPVIMLFTDSIGENQTSVGPLWVEDSDRDPLTYNIVGGADGALFTLSPYLGELAFRTAPNFEAPADADGNNVYEVLVGVSDGTTTTTGTIAVTVVNQNEAPSIIGGSSASYTVGENASAVGTIVAVDPDGGLSYEIIPGSDGTRFSINANTGALRFVAAPDFEAPADANGDNVYQFWVRVRDPGSLSAVQSVTVTVTGVNETPVITSNGGGALAALTVDENSAAVTTVVASDPEGGVTYALAGGADAARFAIDAGTGALSFIAARDFEAPGDANGDNVYEVVVRASDGSLVDTQALAVSIANLNDNAPVIALFQYDSIVSAMAENNVSYFDFDSTDADGDTVVFSLAGQDAASFTVNAATGLVQFLAAPDFEAPGSALGTNSYVFDLLASDGSFSDALHVTLHISNANEPLSITSDGGGTQAAVTVAEHATAVTTVVASDLDLTAPTYAIAGGADAARFAIDAVTGALSFVAPADFEAPGDADGDNIYQVTISAGDGTFADTQAISVTVSDANDAPTIVSNGGGASAVLAVGENLTAVTTVVATDPEGGVTYALVGGADAARFAIDASTGALSFIVAPNFEAPSDVDGNNAYEVVVSASDGSLVDTQALSVTLGNVNEAPVIGSNGGGASAALVVSENTTAVTTVAASDVDSGVTYALAGGADAARFTINAATGVLSFVAAPNFEAPADANGDNDYQVVVSAGDGSLVDTQALTVTVANVNEGPVIGSNGGGAFAALALNENSTAVTTVVATAPGGSVTYALAGGADAARFTINAATGVLRFVAAPNFEAPSDADGNNVYKVVVSASDGSLADTQELAVTVGNVNEAPVISSGGGGTTATYGVSENTTAAITIVASDPESAVTYAIAGGSDAARFTIDQGTGSLRFVSAPDYEAPADADHNNSYQLAVSASDGSLTDTQSLIISVNNLSGTTLNGSSGSETLTGTGEDDTLRGNAGSDTLVGLGGADQLTGGTQADRFVYTALGDSTLATSDRILDFSRAQGDRIDLSAIDANAALGGNQTFNFISSSAFSGSAGQLRYFQQGSDTIVQGDVTGDGMADFHIVLDTPVSLGSVDFVL